MKFILYGKKLINNRIRNIYIKNGTASIKYIKHKGKFITVSSYKKFYCKKGKYIKGGGYTHTIKFNDIQGNILHFLINDQKPFEGSQKFDIVSENNENVLKNIRPDRNPFPKYVAQISSPKSYIQKYTSEILIPTYLQHRDKNIEIAMHNTFTYVIPQCEKMVTNIVNTYFNTIKPFIVLKNQFNDILQYMFVYQGHVTYICAKPSKNQDFYMYTINAFTSTLNKLFNIEKDFENPPGIWTVKHNYSKSYYDYVVKNRLHKTNKPMSTFDISALDQGVVEKIFSHLSLSLEKGKNYTNKELTAVFTK